MPDIATPVPDPRLIRREKLRSDNLVRITGTRMRDGAGDRYIIRLPRGRCRALGIDRWAAVVFEHPMSKNEALADMPGVSGFMVVHCRVLDLPEAGDEPVAEIDQTLRNALGIPFTVGAEAQTLRVWVYPLKGLGPWFRLREQMSSLLGRRFQFFRVAKAAVPDLEKDLVRVPCDYFPILGIPPGSSIICERPVVRLCDDGKIDHFELVEAKVKAFEASEGLLKTRHELMACFPARYFPAAKHLYDIGAFIREYRLLSLVGQEKGSGSAAALLAEPDIPPLFADLHFRRTGADEENVPMTPLTAICARRSVAEVFWREIQASALSFAISLPAFLFGGLQLLLKEDSSSMLAYVMLFLLFLVPVAILGLIGWRVRNQVR